MSLPLQCTKCNFGLKDVIYENIHTHPKAPALLQCNCLIYLCKECVISDVIENINDENHYHFACPLCKTITRDEMFVFPSKGKDNQQTIQSIEIACVDELFSLFPSLKREKVLEVEKSVQPDNVSLIVKKMCSERIISVDLKKIFNSFLPPKSGSQLGNASKQKASYNLRKAIYHLSRIKVIMNIDKKHFFTPDDLSRKNFLTLGILDGILLKTNLMLISVVYNILYDERAVVGHTSRILPMIDTTHCSACLEEIMSEVSPIRMPIHQPCHCNTLKCVNCYLLEVCAESYMDPFGSDANYIRCSLCRAQILVDMSLVKEYFKNIYKECEENEEINNYQISHYPVKRVDKTYDILAKRFLSMIDIQTNVDPNKIYYPTRETVIKCTPNDEINTTEYKNFDKFRGDKFLKENTYDIYLLDDATVLNQDEVDNYRADPIFVGPKKHGLRNFFENDTKQLNIAKFQIAIMYQACWKAVDYPKSNCYTESPSFSIILKKFIPLGNRTSKLIEKYMMYKDGKLSDSEVEGIKNHFGVVNDLNKSKLSVVVPSPSVPHDMSPQLKIQCANDLTADSLANDENIEFVVDRTGDPTAGEKPRPALQWELPHGQMSTSPSQSREQQLQETSHSRNSTVTLTNMTPFLAPEVITGPDTIDYNYTQLRGKLKMYVEKFGTDLYAYLDVMDNPSEQQELQEYFEQSERGAVTLDVHISHCAEPDSFHSTDISTQLTFPVGPSTKVKAIKNQLNRLFYMNIRDLHCRSTSGGQLWDNKSFSFYLIGKGHTIQIRPGTRRPNCLKPDGYRSNSSVENFRNFKDFEARFAAFNLTQTGNKDNSIVRGHEQWNLNERYHRFQRQRQLLSSIPENEINGTSNINDNYNNSNNNNSNDNNNYNYSYCYSQGGSNKNTDTGSSHIAANTEHSALGKRSATNRYEQPFDPSCIDTGALNQSMNMPPLKKKKKQKKSKRNHISSDDDNSDDYSDYGEVFYVGDKVGMV